MASVYDAFTSSYDYGRWLSAIEGLAKGHGLAGTDLLDVACGTGKSFMPMLARGYRVTACDLSPAMVAEASAKSAGLARVFVADMRRMPDCGTFDLITCLDDSLNYLLDESDLEDALAGLAACLKPSGLLVFDTNSLRTYRSVFAGTFADEHDGVFFCWRGEASADLAPGGLAAATLEAFSPDGPQWQRASCRHRQRHHPHAAMLEACARAGLEVLETRGQHPGARLDELPDETTHTKLLYIARRREERGCHGRHSVIADRAPAASVRPPAVPGRP
jgi:SAM-dependent methyltransferase